MSAPGVERIQHLWDEIFEIDIAVGLDVVVQRPDPAIIAVLAHPHGVHRDDIGIGCLAHEGGDQARVQRVIGQALQVDLDTSFLGEIIQDLFQRKLEWVTHDQDSDFLGLGPNRGRQCRFGF